jgi:hypothetical protein
LRSRTWRSGTGGSANRWSVAVNVALESAPPEVLERLAGGPQSSIVRRWRHREEHVEQIARAIG